MIGISEGIVLADRYRLTRRQSERETGASWIAVDLETGSDVWVQFADHGGLAQAADIIRGLTESSASSLSAALPSVLDTGELRMIVDSRAIAALRGGAEAHSTHVEIVIEFVVVKPLAGRGLPAKIQRKALPPAEALAIAATLAGALGAALAVGGSHGWLGPGSVWLVRRGGCVLDLALGLAYPDGSVIELEQQVTGYFAPERLAIAGAAGASGAGAAVGSGSKATEAADVFALGWMLYEMLVGHAELVAEYERLVAGAGAVTTVELLVLWRARARVHLTELVEADSALALLVLACLAENPAERPDFAAFSERARGAAKALAGVAPLVLPVARTRPAAEAGIAVAEVAAAAAVVGAGVVVGEALAAEALAGEALAGEALAAEVVQGADVADVASIAELADVADVADVAGVGDMGTEAGTTTGTEAGGASAGGLGVASGAASVTASGSEESAASAVVAEAETVVLAAAIGAGVAGAGAVETGAASASAAETGGVEAGTASAGAMGAVAFSAFGAEGLAGSGSHGGSAGSGGAGGSAGSGGEAAGEHEKELERLSHRARLATIGGTAAAVVALGVGVAVGYSVGHGGNNSTTLTSVGTNAVVPISSASSSPVAAPAPTVTVTVTVTVTEAVAASPSASASASASSSSAASGSTSSTPSSAPSTISSPALPAPSSAGEAISELTQEIQYLRGSGQISKSTSEQLTTAVSKLKSSLGTSSSSSSLSSLTSLIRSLKGSGHLSSTAEATLESILGYFYAGSGS